VDTAANAAPPLAQCPPERWAALRGVLTDIDDTLTHDARLEPAAADALAALQAARVPVLAVTGRSLGWCREVAAAWPAAGALVALVAENGAVALWREGRRWRTVYTEPQARRRAHARRLAACAAAVCRQVPGARLARDSAGRETDIAIDHAEHAQLSAAAIDRVVALMHGHGLQASVSSIHVNGWIGTQNKFSGAAWMLRHRLGVTLAAEPGRWVYVGDSTNDELMFERLPFTVGVANLLRFAGRLRHWPSYLTAGERGRGFAEVALALLAARPQARGAGA
jgi:HAD superfamily hydrolase (TIGR01484 family)